MSSWKGNVKTSCTFLTGSNYILKINSANGHLTVRFMTFLFQNAKYGEFTSFLIGAICINGKMSTKNSLYGEILYIEVSLYNKMSNVFHNIFTQELTN